MLSEADALNPIDLEPSALCPTTFEPVRSVLSPEPPIEPEPLNVFPSIVALHDFEADEDIFDGLFSMRVKLTVDWFAPTFVDDSHTLS